MYMYKITKNLYKSECEAALLKQQMIRVSKDSCEAKKLPHWSYLPLPHNEKICINPKLKVIYLKLMANDRSNKNFLCYLKLAPSGYIPLPLGYIRHKTVKSHKLNRFFCNLRFALFKIWPSRAYLPLPLESDLSEASSNWSESRSVPFEEKIVPCHAGFGFPYPGGIQKKIHLSGKIGEWNRFVAAGYHAIVCDAFFH